MPAALAFSTDIEASGVPQLYADGVRRGLRAQRFEPSIYSDELILIERAWRQHLSAGWAAQQVITDRLSRFNHQKRPSATSPARPFSG